MSNVYQKRAKATTIDGIMYSDPSYKSDVWCRYEIELNGKDWVADYKAVDKNDDGYEYFDFAFVLSHPSYADKINIGQDLSSFVCPETLQVSETEIGMDTACVYLGVPHTFNEDEWQPLSAIRTGTDGAFGSVYEFSIMDDNSDKNVVAVALFGYFDATFGSKEGLWVHLVDNFNLSI